MEEAGELGVAMAQRKARTKGELQEISASDGGEKLKHPDGVRFKCGGQG